MRALDLFCGGGGVSVGLVESRPLHHRDSRPGLFKCNGCGESAMGPRKLYAESSPYFQQVEGASIHLRSGSWIGWRGLGE
jgi:hypothetical protein